MVDPSLPPGTTHADIDDAFGDPGRQIASGSVDVAVEVEVSGSLTDDEIKDALAEAVGENLDESDERIIEVVGVTVGEVFDA